MLPKAYKTNKITTDIEKVHKLKIRIKSNVIYRINFLINCFLLRFLLNRIL